MDEQPTTNSSANGGNKTMIIVAVAVIVVIALVVIGWLVLTKNKQQPAVQAPAENTTTESPVEPTESSKVPES